MSKPTMMVPMTAEEFDRYVLKFGCPECGVYCIPHYTSCTLGETRNSLIQLTQQTGSR